MVCGLITDAGRDCARARHATTRISRFFHCFGFPRIPQKDRHCRDCVRREAAIGSPSFLVVTAAVIGNHSRLQYRSVHPLITSTQRTPLQSLAPIHSRGLTRNGRNSRKLPLSMLLVYPGRPADPGKESRAMKPREGNAACHCCFHFHEALCSASSLLGFRSRDVCAPPPILHSSTTPWTRREEGIIYPRVCEWECRRRCHKYARAGGDTDNIFLPSFKAE